MENKEEIRIEETTIEEMNYPVEIDDYMEPEFEGESGKGKLVAAGLAILGIGAAAFVIKNKNKLADKKAKKAAKKLEKLGYMVISPEEIIDEEECDFDDSEKEEVVPEEVKA